MGNYKETHLQQPENWAVLTGAKIVYSAGFFATVSPSSIKLAAEETVKTGAFYCLNLSAPFLMQVPPFKAVLVDTMKYVDFLFCNEPEAYCGCHARRRPNRCGHQWNGDAVSGHTF